MWTGKKVVVTGAGGFIGSHLVEALVAAGASVTAMVRYNSGSLIGNLAFLDRRAADAVRIVSGNVEDSDFVYRAVEGQEIVLHLAALIAIPYSYEAPRSYVRTNIEGHAERPGSRETLRCRPRRAYQYLGGLRHRLQGADRRNPSAAGPIALLGLEDRAPTNWPKATIAPSAHRWSRYGHLTPSGHARARGLSSPRSSPRPSSETRSGLAR